MGPALLPVMGTGYPVRIDIAKRMAARQKTRYYSKLEYHQGPDGNMIRNFPKKPSEHDMKKNTRRARIYTKWAVDLAAKVEEKS